MELFRVALKSKNAWNKKIRNLYVIADNKQKAIDYTNQYKKIDFEIYKIYYLGYEASSRMFIGGKEE